MFTWGSKYLYAISAAALLGAVVYGLVTGGDLIGVISVGYKGGVGDHVGYALFLFAAASAFVLGTVAVAARDGDGEELAARVGVEQVPPVTPPADPAYWGPLTALGLGSLIVGLAVSRAFFYLGLAVLAVALFQWLIQTWADRATGDPEVNRVIRERLIGPFEVPLIAGLVIAFIVLGVSRIFLAVPSAVWSVVIGCVATIIVFGLAVLFSSFKVKRSLITGAVVIGALAVLVGGIVSAAVGERDIHHGAAQVEESE